MKRWYVVQIYAGYEAKIKADLERRIQESPFGDKFGGIHFPSAKMKQVFSSGEEEDQQLFPGYMLLEAELTPEVMQTVLDVFRVILHFPLITPFASFQSPERKRGVHAVTPRSRSGL